jgi:hypothetical protein
MKGENGAVERITGEVQEQLQELQDNEEEVAQLCKDLRLAQQAVHQDSTHKQDQLRTFIDELRALADEREQHMVEEIRLLEEEKLSKLRAQLEQCWNQQQELKRLSHETLSILGDRAPINLLQQIKLLSQWCGPRINPYEEELDTTIQDFIEDEPCVSDSVEKTIPEYENLLPIQPEQLDMLDFKENIEKKKSVAEQNPDSESVYAVKQAQLQELEETNIARDELRGKVDAMRAKEKKLLELIAAQQMELDQVDDESSEEDDDDDDDEDDDEDDEDDSEDDSEEGEDM